MNEEIETNRIAELGTNGARPPIRLTLGQTGCVATLDEQGIIHITNQEHQQLYALRSDQIPMAEPQLLVTLNLWFMAYSNGQRSVQQEFKAKFGELLKLCL